MVETKQILKKPPSFKSAAFLFLIVSASKALQLARYFINRNPIIKTFAKNAIAPIRYTVTPTSIVKPLTPNSITPAPNTVAPTPNVKPPTPNVKALATNVKAPATNTVTPAPIVKRNNHGCSYTSPKPFIIKDTNLAKANFNTNLNTGCTPLSIYCTNFSNTTVTITTNAYVWYVNGDSATTQNLNYTFIDTGKYVITLLAYETFRNCSATFTNTITVKDCPPDSISITVPNIFSPNTDGINDAWQLLVYNFNYTISNYQCTIYDRWGVKVFETNNLNQIWDGRTTSGLACSAGAYYYIIKLTATNSKGLSQQKDVKGFLELVR